MKKIIFLFFILLSAFNVNAQSSRQVEDGLFKINAIALRVFYELGVGAKTALNA